jgi:transcription elongation factor Elf1
MSAETGPSPPHALTSSRCSRCQGSTMVQRITPSRTGYQHWTLQCTYCGHIHQMQVVSKPLRSDAVDWFDSDLYCLK